jgi:maleate isomerase/arylmalonate decarboxylase
MSAANRGTARIGLLVPFTNTNLEPDIALLAPPGVSIHSARLGGYDIDVIPDADQMAGLGASDIDEPLRLLAGVRPDVVLYGCTSATLSHGVAFDRDLSAKVTAMSGAKTITAAGALVAALTTLKARKIAFASPYVAALNDMAIAFLAECGFETVARADYPVALGNYGQGELTPDAVFDLAMRAHSDDADALVLSCTDMRSVEMIARLEVATGKPVITSNQAMMRIVLDYLGLPSSQSGFGRLLSDRTIP